MMSCSKVRTMMTSHMREITCAASSTGFAHNERRQQADHVLRGDVDHEAGVQRLSYELAARACELDADHEAHAAHFARDVADLILQGRLNQFTDAPGIGEQAFLLDG